MTLSPSPLSADELGRYARHIVLPRSGDRGSSG